MNSPAPQSSAQDRDAALFNAALAKAPAERSAFLNEACQGDPALHARLKARLAAEGAASDPSTVPDFAPAAGPPSRDSRSAVDEEVGQILGRYKLLEKLGEGGFGTVWAAEQREPVKRRVALKIIKLGMDTKQVVARFEAERMALAIMDHPCIAKVLDAGATDAGRPFFVMELVRGISITQYCDQANLPTKERLHLFIKVCQAIQHAHQKGVIHRDIKPSNILVTLSDGVAVPKVIDFGIAKATEGRLSDATVYTQLHQFMGTPAYMSPEQAEMSGLDIDTRSDIYSLGVVLYELLTGTTPFDSKELMSGGVDGMRRTIRETEPDCPSTRLAALPPDQLTQTAKRRSSDASKLIHQLKGDLDWIVMKCLEKERTRRYETANGLGSDLSRHLNNELITARPATAAYKLRKFARRNRGGMAAAIAITTLLIVGIIATSRLALVATRARDLAAREAVRSAEVAEFLKEMLESAGPSRARGQDTTMLREIMDNAAQRVGSRLKSQPEVEFELRAILGRTYLAVGSYADAEKMQRSALDLADRIYGHRHTNMVVVMGELGGLLNDVGRLPEATNLLGQAISMSRELAGDDHPLTAEAMRRQGIVFADLGKYPEAEQLLAPATEIMVRQLGVDDPRTLRCRHNLASLFFRQGKLAKMEKVVLANLADAKRALGNEDPLTLNISATLALLRQSQGRFEEAEVLHSAILETKRKILGEDHPNTLLSMDYLALVQSALGRFSEAETLTRSALDIFARTSKGQSGWELALRNNHAEHLRNLGRHAEAEAEYHKVLETAEKTTTPTDPTVLATRENLAILREFQGRLSEAESILRDLLRIRAEELSANDPDLAITRSHLAGILLAAGKFNEAGTLARESFAVFEARDPDDWRRYAVESLVGGCRLAAGDPAGAENLLHHGYEGLAARASRIPAIDQFRIREALERLVALYSTLHQPAESAKWRQRLEQFDQSPAGRRLAEAKTPRPSP
ncbi:MAG: serine/threonine protein kinase [Verrucomicrobiales bacterium]|nr:serine/threonine protein kinase [Verrucomicrobiales bacterium]